jgi:hypothetical protein
MIAEQYPGLLDRPDEEKLQLAGELWHAVIGHDEGGDDPTLVALMEKHLSVRLGMALAAKSFSPGRSV